MVEYNHFSSKLTVSLHCACCAVSRTVGPVYWLILLSFHSPNKQDFITAKYKNLSYVPRLARDKDDYDSRDDLNKVL